MGLFSLRTDTCICMCAAATGAVRASPPESLTSSWNGPSQQGPSVVPQDPAHLPPSPNQAVPGPVQHGRRHGRGPDASHESLEAPQQADAEASRGTSRPESAAYKAKVLPRLPSQHKQLTMHSGPELAHLQSAAGPAQTDSGFHRAIPGYKYKLTCIVCISSLRVRQACSNQSKPVRSRLHWQPEADARLAQTVLQHA